MRNFQALCLLLVIAGIAGCNKDEDPGPDLTSGTVSFRWNTPDLITKFYVVISDTTGRVLQWAKLDNNVAKDFPYPPGDSRLANVTIIAYTDFASGTNSLSLQTFTGLPADSYSYDLPQVQQLVPDGDFKITLKDRSQFFNVTHYISGEKFFKSQNSTAESEELIYGLKSGKSNDLYIQMLKTGESAYRYLHVPGIKGGEGKTIGAADFSSLPLLPIHTINYPAHTQMEMTLMFLAGMDDGSNGSYGTYGIYFNQWNKSQTPDIGYPVIPNLFPKYSTVLVSAAANGDSYYTLAVDDEPLRTFTLLQGDLVKYDPLTTKRISADLTGTADIVHTSGTWGDNNDAINWDVYAPMTTKLRINPPTSFPEDLLDELPGLALLEDEEFDGFSLENLNMSYKEFHDYLLKGNFYVDPPFLQAKSFMVEPGNGRRSNDPQAILKRLGSNIPAQVDKIQKTLPN